jgi:VIT1/CCC1 family predicted Fe2+/Mn2+ transporter
VTSHPLADCVAAIGSDAHVAVGTGLGTALSSFCFFASGALVPVLPHLFGLQGTTALVVASLLVGIALLATSATVGFLSV